MDNNKKDNKTENKKKDMSWYMLILQWALFYFAIKFMPRGKLSFLKLTIMIIISAFLFALIEMFSPTISNMCMRRFTSTLSFRTLKS